tara:strand:- start:405 stop:869 length:465 start_codon:yes stop_codon:yes gene_type:complete
MNSKERLDLKKLINESGCENNTEKIRELKHSELIFKDIQNYLSIKQKHENDADFKEKCITACRFLYDNYNDIFHKLYNNELNLVLMERLLNTLAQIEQGKVDQHEASVIVGKLLKEIYIDSALAKSKKIDDENQTEYKDSKKISYKEYKNKMSK